MTQVPNLDAAEQGVDAKRFKLLNAWFALVSVFLLISLTANILLGASFFTGGSGLVTPSPASGQTTSQDILTLIGRYSLYDLPSSEELYRAQLKGMVSGLEDPYSEFLPADEAEDFRNSINERYEGIGVRFEFVRGEVVVVQVLNGSPAEESGVQVGDVFFKINGELAEDIEDGNIADKVRGPSGTDVKIIFLRDEKEVPITITRRAIQTPLLSLEIQENVGIITITSFGEGLDERMQEVVAKLKQNPNVTELIVDVRGNTGGLLSETIEVMSYFVPERTLLLYEVNNDGEEQVFSTAKDDYLQEFELTILVNSYSASASEILAGALKDEADARIVGQVTFGKGSVQQLFPLKNGDHLKITVSKWLRPSKEVIDQKGLTPDVELPVSEDSLQWALQNRLKS